MILRKKNPRSNLSHCLCLSYLVYGAHISMLFILKSSSCVFNQYFLSGQKYREYYVPLKMPEYI